VQIRRLGLAALTFATLMILVPFSHALASHESGFSIQPEVGGVTITAFTGSLEAFDAEGRELALVSCFATLDGQFIGYLLGAPSFVSAAFVEHFEAGLDQVLLLCRRHDERPPAQASTFDTAQVVSIYGYPGIPTMGLLGAYSPADAVLQVAARAQQYEDINRANDIARDVVPALHLIAAVAQRSPTSDGTYLARLSDEVIEQYVTATRDAGQLLFLDIQVGWSTPVAEARRVARWLQEPHVHLAVDPEFATSADGVAPGTAIGTVTGAQINEVQAYVHDLALEHHLPRKILIVHQFRDDMITTPAAIEPYSHVDLVIDMDGFGPWNVKLAGYNRYALAEYSEYAGFKLFVNWDTPLRTPAEIQAMERPPDLIIYQ